MEWGVFCPGDVRSSQLVRPSSCPSTSIYRVALGWYLTSWYLLFWVFEVSKQTIFWQEENRSDRPVKLSFISPRLVFDTLLTTEYAAILSQGSAASVSASRGNGWGNVSCYVQCDCPKSLCECKEGLHWNFCLPPLSFGSKHKKYIILSHWHTYHNFILQQL